MLAGYEGNRRQAGTVSGVKGSPLVEMPVVMQLGAAEEVSQRIVHTWPMLGLDGDIIAESDAVKLTKEASEHFTPSCLSIDDVYISAVIDIEE